jgi:hypothetical protein
VRLTLDYKFAFSNQIMGLNTRIGFCILSRYDCSSGYFQTFYYSNNLHGSENKFLVRDQPQTQLKTSSYLIMTEILSKNFWTPLVSSKSDISFFVKLCIGFVTKSLQGHTESALKCQIKSDFNLMTISLQTHTNTLSKLKSEGKFQVTKTLPSGD